jgi:hypothetical protein
MFPYFNIAKLTVARKECVIISTERETVYTVCPYTLRHLKQHTIEYTQYRQYTCNVTLRRVRANIVTVEKQ